MEGDQGKKIEVVYVPMGQYPIIKAMKSGELREDGKSIHWILLCMTWQIVAICVVLVVKCAILLSAFALFSDLCR